MSPWRLPMGMPRQRWSQWRCLLVPVNFSGLRLLSQAEALRRPWLQGSSCRQLSPIVGCWTGSLPVLSMTSVVGALVSHLLHHTQPWGKRGDDVSVTGVRRPGRIHILTSWGRQCNLLLGTSYRRWVRVARNWTSRGPPGFRDPVPCTLTRVRCTGTQSLRVGDSFGGPLSKCHQLGHYGVDCHQPADEPMKTAHGDASAEVIPMEVSPGPSEQGRPVKEPASSSLDTSSRPAEADTEEDQSREECTGGGPGKGCTCNHRQNGDKQHARFGKYITVYGSPKLYSGSNDI